MASFTLAVKPLHGTEPVQLTMLRSDTVQALWDKLEPIGGCAVPVLMYRGVVLEPTRTLGSYGLHELAALPSTSASTASSSSGTPSAPVPVVHQVLLRGGPPPKPIALTRAEVDRRLKRARTATPDAPLLHLTVADFVGGIHLSIAPTATAADLSLVYSLVRGNLLQPPPSEGKSTATTAAAEIPADVSSWVEVKSDSGDGSGGHILCERFVIPPAPSKPAPTATASTAAPSTSAAPAPAVTSGGAAASKLVTMDVYWPTASYPDGVPEELVARRANIAANDTKTLAEFGVTDGQRLLTIRKPYGLLHIVPMSWAWRHAETPDPNPPFTFPAYSTPDAAITAASDDVLSGSTSTASTAIPVHVHCLESVTLDSKTKVITFRVDPAQWTVARLRLALAAQMGMLQPADRQACFVPSRLILDGVILHDSKPDAEPASAASDASPSATADPPSSDAKQAVGAATPSAAGAPLLTLADYGVKAHSKVFWAKGVARAIFPKASAPVTATATTESQAAK